MPQKCIIKFKKKKIGSPPVYKSVETVLLFTLKLPHPRGDVLNGCGPGERRPESSDSIDASESVRERVLYSLTGEQMPFVGVGGGLVKVGDWAPDTWD